MRGCCAKRLELALWYIEVIVGSTILEFDSKGLAALVVADGSEVCGAYWNHVHKLLILFYLVCVRSEDFVVSIDARLPNSLVGCRGVDSNHPAHRSHHHLPLGRLEPPLGDQCCRDDDFWVARQ